MLILFLASGQWLFDLVKDHCRRDEWYLFGRLILFELPR